MRERGHREHEDVGPSGHGGTGGHREIGAGGATGGRGCRHLSGSVGICRDAATAGGGGEGASQGALRVWERGGGRKWGAPVVTGGAGDRTRPSVRYGAGGGAEGGAEQDTRVRRDPR